MTLNMVDATIGNAFDEMQVRQLPLLTRNVVELLSLQPGVTPTGEVVGARRDQNNITLDGVDVNDNQTAGLENSSGNASQPGYNFNPTASFARAASMRRCRFRSIPFRSFASRLRARTPTRAAAPAGR